MAEKPQVHFPGVYYHITARGNKRQKILLNDWDYQLSFEPFAGMKAVTEHFNRDPVVISQVMTKVKQKLMPDGAVRQTITTLEEALTRNRKKKKRIII